MKIDVKKGFVLTAAALAFAALPAQASAKDRGCAYRLTSLTEAEIAVDKAQTRGIGVAEARAQLVRAREMALEEGCLAARPAPGVEHARWEGRDVRERRDWSRSPRVRFERLLELGYRRGLSRDEFHELEQLRRRLY